MKKFIVCSLIAILFLGFLGTISCSNCCRKPADSAQNAEITQNKHYTIEALVPDQIISVTITWLPDPDENDTAFKQGIKEISKKYLITSITPIEKEIYNNASYTACLILLVEPKK